jgi:hypothetical protein
MIKIAHQAYSRLFANHNKPLAKASARSANHKLWFVEPSSFEMGILGFPELRWSVGRLRSPFTTS